jgi:hypothetical protein
MQKGEQMNTNIFERNLASGGGGNFDDPTRPVAYEDNEPERDEDENRLGTLIMRLSKIGHTPLEAYLGDEPAKAYRILKSLEPPVTPQWYQ